MKENMKMAREREKKYQSFNLPCDPTNCYLGHTLIVLSVHEKPQLFSQENAVSCCPGKDFTFSSEWREMVNIPFPF